MKLEQFQNIVKKIEQDLSNATESKTEWIEPQWFHVDPKNDNYSSVSIRFEFDEVKVGIDHVKEYYSDKYGKDRTYNDGFERFSELLRSRIKRQVKYKGNFPYRTDYLVERNGKFEMFASLLTWAFPFWKKTRIDEFIQSPILTNE